MSDNILPWAMITRLVKDARRKQLLLALLNLRRRQYGRLYGRKLRQILATALDTHSGQEVLL